MLHHPYGLIRAALQPVTRFASCCQRSRKSAPSPMSACTPLPSHRRVQARLRASTPARLGHARPCVRLCPCVRLGAHRHSRFACFLPRVASGPAGLCDGPLRVLYADGRASHFALPNRPLRLSLRRRTLGDRRGSRACGRAPLAGEIAGIGPAVHSSTERTALYSQLPPAPPTRTLCYCH